MTAWSSSAADRRVLVAVANSGKLASVAIVDSDVDTRVVTEAMLIEFVLAVLSARVKKNVKKKTFFNHHKKRTIIGSHKAPPEICIHNACMQYATATTATAAT